MGSLTSVREDARLSSESCLPTFAVAENCIENTWDTTAVQVVGRQVRALPNLPRVWFVLARPPVALHDHGNEIPNSGGRKAPYQVDGMRDGL